MISEFVEYVKQIWNNKPNSSSPLNADHLNHMEAGIENNSKKIKEIVPAVNELTEKRKLIEKEFSSGNISITPAMTYKLPYTVPDGYEYLGFLGAESYNVPTSISYQGNTGSAIALYVNCFGNGGTGSINMRLQFQRK